LKLKSLSKRKNTIVFLGLGLLLFSLSLQTKLLIGKSDSLPYHVYLLLKNSSFQKGDFVGISKWHTKYTTNKHFTKRIIGVHGDVIKVTKNFIYINGKKLAYKTHTKNHEVLTPIKPQVIPKGAYFVMALHQDSFDSRYEEFGLVRHEYIEGKAIPLW
jgi:conjugative transfer signal peptidase TraF